MKKIYKTYLQNYQACKYQVRLFAKHYPEGINVCHECFEEAQDKGLDVWWLSRWMYNNLSALQRYNRICAFLAKYSSMGGLETKRKINKKGLQILEKKLLKIDWKKLRINHQQGGRRYPRSNVAF